MIDHLTQPVPGFSLTNKKPIQLLKPARWWKRLLAFIADIIILEATVGRPFRQFMPTELSFNMQLSSATLAASIILPVLFLTYFIACQYVLGQTIGMMLFGMRVARTDEGLWRFVVRNLFILPFFPFMILWLLDPLFLAFTKRRLSELWSGTITAEVV